MFDVMAVIDQAATTMGVAMTCSAFFIVSRIFVGGNRFSPIQKEANYGCAVGLFALGHVTRAGMGWTDLAFVVGASGLLFMVGLRGTSERRADPQVI